MTGVTAGGQPRLERPVTSREQEAGLHHPILRPRGLGVLKFCWAAKFSVPRHTDIARQRAASEAAAAFCTSVAGAVSAGSVTYRDANDCGLAPSRAYVLHLPELAAVGMLGFAR